MKMVYDEWYGVLSFSQRAAYRKHNVSQSDHDELVDVFGDDHNSITKAVKDPKNQTSGMFCSFAFNENRYN